MKNPLVKEVENALTNAGIDPALKVVVGVSGGPDSLALLHILKEIRPKESLVIGHLNHKLREEADGEASFVAQTADAWAIPIVIGQEDVGELARAKGMTIEEAAREARYSFLIKVAQDVGARAIIVGHNADDQVETVLLNLLRGSGLAGLRGMEVVRHFSEVEDIVLIRPFLFSWRSAIETYCREFNLRPRIDSSNENRTFKRNFIRHEILPRLAQVNPEYKRHISQLSQLIAPDEKFLAQETEKAWVAILEEQKEEWLRLDRQKWVNLPLSLQRRTLRHAVYLFQETETEISFRTIEQALNVARSGFTGARSTLPNNLEIQVGYDGLIIKRLLTGNKNNYPQLIPDEILRLNIPGSTLLSGGWEIEARLAEGGSLSYRQNKDPWRAYVNIESGVKFQIRSRNPGERFQPLGMGGRSTSIQDYMVNKKIPAAMRPLWPIVVNGEQPVWIVGHQIDERAKLSSKSEQVILLICRKSKE